MDAVKTTFILMAANLTEAVDNCTRVAWPTADFDEWPSTRTAALMFDGIVALIVIAAILAPRARKRACGVCGNAESACQRFVVPLLLGLLFGLWLHFIPCIWWTCDWGCHDGAGIRGGIWFVTWGIVSVALCCTRSQQRTPRSKDNELSSGGAF